MTTLIILVIGFLIVLHFSFWKGMMSFAINNEFKKWFRWTILIPLSPFLIAMVYCIGLVFLDIKKDFKMDEDKNEDDN